MIWGRLSGEANAWWEVLDNRLNHRSSQCTFLYWLSGTLWCCDNQKRKITTTVRIKSQSCLVTLPINSYICWVSLALAWWSPKALPGRFWLQRKLHDIIFGPLGFGTSTYKMLELREINLGDIGRWTELLPVKLIRFSVPFSKELKCLETRIARQSIQMAVPNTVTETAPPFAPCHRLPCRPAHKSNLHVPEASLGWLLDGWCKIQQKERKCKTVWQYFRTTARKCNRKGLPTQDQWLDCQTHQFTVICVIIYIH